MSRASVVETLGDPGYWADMNTGETIDQALFYDYHGIRLMFKDDQVDSLTVSTRADWNDSPIEWEDEFIGEEVTSEALRGFLVERDIEFSKKNLEAVLDAEWRTMGGVFLCMQYHVVFNENEDGSFNKSKSSEKYLSSLVVMCGF